MQVNVAGIVSDERLREFRVVERLRRCLGTQMGLQTLHIVTVAKDLAVDILQVVVNVHDYLGLGSLFAL